MNWAVYMGGKKGKDNEFNIYFTFHIGWGGRKNKNWKCFIFEIVKFTKILTDDWSLYRLFYLFILNWLQTWKKVTLRLYGRERILTKYQFIRLSLGIHLFFLRVAYDSIAAKKGSHLPTMSDKKIAMKQLKKIHKGNRIQHRRRDLTVL